MSCPLACLHHLSTVLSWTADFVLCLLLGSRNPFDKILLRAVLLGNDQCLCSRTFFISVLKSVSRPPWREWARWSSAKNAGIRFIDRCLMSFQQQVFWGMSLCSYQLSPASVHWSHADKARLWWWLCTKLEDRVYEPFFKVVPKQVFWGCQLNHSVGIGFLKVGKRGLIFTERQLESLEQDYKPSRTCLGKSLSCANSGPETGFSWQ